MRPSKYRASSWELAIPKNIWITNHLERFFEYELLLIPKKHTKLILKRIFEHHCGSNTESFNSYLDISNIVTEL